MFFLVYVCLCECVCMHVWAHGYPCCVYTRGRGYWLSSSVTLCLLFLSLNLRLLFFLISWKPISLVIILPLLPHSMGHMHNGGSELLSSWLQARVFNWQAISPAPYLYIWDLVLNWLDWFWTPYEAEDDLEFPIFLLSSKVLGFQLSVPGSTLLYWKVVINMHAS